MTSVPPGWYPDPAAPESGSQRWWSGEAWTQHVQAALPPIPPPPSVPQVPTASAYVPLSPGNASYPSVPATRRVRSRTVIIAAAVVLVAALGAGAWFGIPALVGGSGSLTTALQQLGPTPKPVAIPVGPDLGATTAPPKMAPTTAPANLHPTASSITTVEEYDLAQTRSSMPSCDPLTYGAPVTNVDTAATDSLQILQPYASTTIAVTAVARQEPTIQAVREQEQALTALGALCSSYTNAVGAVTVNWVTGSDLAPAAQMEWVTTETGANGKSIRIDTTQVAYSNRMARIECIETSESAASNKECDYERAAVSQLMVAAAKATPGQ